MFEVVLACRTIVFVLSLFILSKTIFDFNTIIIY